MKGFLRLFMNYGLMASILVSTSLVAVLAYRIEGSPWRWPFVALVFGGLGTIAGIFWIRKYVDKQTKASEQGSQQVKAKIHVTLKQGILDPQGKAIEHALDSLGFKNAGNVRVGKYMEVDVDETDKAKADAAVKAMCEKLLANTIVEEYRYELG